MNEFQLQKSRMIKKIIELGDITRNNIPLGDLDNIFAHYADSNRHYHNDEHIVSMGTELSRLIEENVFNIDKYQELCLYLSILFHDYIYKTSSQWDIENNEYESARVSSHYMNIRWGMGFIVCGAVEDCIIATRHKYTGINLLCQIVCDIDLLGLAADENQFYINSVNIESEYSSYDKKDFQKGRLDFIHSFLKKDRIFFTDYYHEKHEAKARQNLLELYQKTCESLWGNKNANV